MPYLYLHGFSVTMVYIKNSAMCQAANILTRSHFEGRSSNTLTQDEQQNYSLLSHIFSPPCSQGIQDISTKQHIMK